MLLKDPDALVERALSLLFPPEWADLVVDIAVCTSRRLLLINEKVTKWLRMIKRGDYEEWRVLSS
ncbi:hypothetical protein KSC_103130 [Ktedonobacter sp. SOSP1-52]|nr:hypothetical protein KSC_103130 [Ktedonobacter sp. SOSP1-52]